MKKFKKINVFEAVNKQVLDGIKKSGMVQGMVRFKRKHSRPY